MPLGTLTIFPCSSPIYCPVTSSPDTAADPLEGTQTGRALVRKSNAGKGDNLLLGRSLPQPPVACLAETVRKLRMTQKRRQRGRMAPASVDPRESLKRGWGIVIYTGWGAKSTLSMKWSQRHLCKKLVIFYKLFLTCFSSRHIVSYLEDNAHFSQ